MDDRTYLVTYEITIEVEARDEQHARSRARSEMFNGGWRDAVVTDVREQQETSDGE